MVDRYHATTTRKSHRENVLDRDVVDAVVQVDAFRFARADEAGESNDVGDVPRLVDFAYGWIDLDIRALLSCPCDDRIAAFSRRKHGAHV
jgi:hypothetical protein